MAHIDTPADLLTTVMAQPPLAAGATVLLVVFGVAFCVLLLIVIVRLAVPARHPGARVRRGLMRPGAPWPIPGVEPPLPGDPADPLHMHGHAGHHPQADPGPAPGGHDAGGHHHQHHHHHDAGDCGGHHHGHSHDAGGHGGGFDAGGHSAGFDAGGHGGGHH